MSSSRLRSRAAAVAAAVLVLAALLAAAPPEARKANYDLASRWTPAKVGKLVFDTSVSPHWLETGDRFWYTFETAQGRKWYLVDPAARSKRPLFDNAKMAAQLTRILLVPYDAQHLPIKTIKFVKKDTAIQFEIEVPKDNDILVGGKIVKASEIAKEEEKKDLDADKEKEKEKEQDTQKDKGKAADKPKAKSQAQSPSTAPREPEGSFDHAEIGDPPAAGDAAPHRRTAGAATP